MLLFISARARRPVLLDLFSRDIEQMITLRDVEALSDLADRIRARGMQQTSIAALLR
jgi:hypothetical protein